MKRMEVCHRAPVVLPPGQSVFRVAGAATPLASASSLAAAALPGGALTSGTIAGSSTVPQNDLSNVLHQYHSIATANNPAAAAAEATAAAAQYFYPPMTTLMPYGMIPNAAEKRSKLVGVPGSSAFSTGNRQPQYMPFGPAATAASSLVPQFIPVSIVDPLVAAQAQAAQAVCFYNSLLFPLGFPFNQ